ncbi:RNA elimination defective protein Red1 [Aspergillus melleus]|uniref:RNA elimination defective protein Red1 n=1 Tax=Aspergillus melleus TaxID=138277 RepID=UPI001E8EAA38|nr:RNA elimination defective protein Red1 [Aspergillus melleus]KAH8427719.1 RNA elimination defective protein Red1 [Aspergillus melleus]
MERKLSALITGCGKGGIGHALASQFIAGGYTVIATLLPHEARDHLEDLGVHVFVSDVTSDSQCESLFESIRDLTQGKLDVLINNAGIVYTMPAVDTDVSQVEKMFAVNVLGPMRMVRVFHKSIVAAKGTVVNIGSIGGIVPYIYGASYNASKAALHAYGNTLRAEMKPFGVKVITVISGEVGTNILKRDYDASLPADSIFQPLSEEFKAHVRRTPNTMTPAEYASGVFAEVQKSSPSAWFWHGNLTTIIRIWDAMLPRTFWDWFFARDFQFDKLRKAVEEGEKARAKVD